VQRLRYFDGEYLRSYDFTDEQSYHVEMRRLMNLKLHLHGIIYGLEIVQDQDSAPPTYFYSVAHGMAIDQIGREIVVPAPYSLTNVLTAPGLTTGCYEVWICYQESETGLPAAGYLDCNVQNQNTRWQESFQVYLKPTVGQSLVADCGGVRLGVVQLIKTGLGLQIANPIFNVERRYVGIRAQSIIAPDQVDPDTFDIEALTTPVPDQPLPGYLDVHPGVFNHGNVIVKKNLVVGDDFVLNSSNNKLPSYDSNLPGSLGPSTTGDLKVSSDFFLQGNFYGFDTTSGKWYQLKQLIQSLMPFDVQVGAAPIQINLPAAAPYPGGFGNTFTPSVPTPVPAVQSILATVSNATVFLSIYEIDWTNGKALVDWDTDTDGFIFKVFPVISGITNPLNFSVNCTVGPVLPPGPTGALPITSLWVNYLVIFQP
jgi:hypothetical protein